MDLTRRRSFAFERAPAAIFPEGPWWLTDVSRRAEEQKSNAHADVEDGPPSEMEEGLAAEVSDEDPLSEQEYEPPRHNHTSLDE